MHHGEPPHVLAAFPTSLGWMAALWSGPLLKRVTFDHRSPKSAAGALSCTAQTPDDPNMEQRRLVERLTAFADGEVDDFRDVRIDLYSMTDFQRRIVDHCRRIPWGQTLSYGQLAAQSGRPRAARAVGNVMAANQFPLMVPCHRVVGSGGSLGGYSAHGGLRIKRRLLDREAPLAAIA